MKTRRNKKLTLTLAALAVVSLALSSPAAVIVSDTFDLPTGTTGQQFDLQTNQAARQSGGSVGVTYSDKSAAIGANTQVYLNQDAAYDSTGVLWLRNYYNAAGSYQIGAAAAGINEDLSTQLAGKNYTVSYSGMMSDFNGNIVGQSYVDSWYQGFSLGGSNPYEPGAANTDLGFSVYQNNVGLIHADGVLQWAGAVPGLSVGSAYDVEIDVDEVAQTASISIDAGGTVTDLGTYTVGFEAGDLTREIQFNNRIATFDSFGTSHGMIIADAQVNDLQIDVIPEPATLGLMGVAVLGLAAYRRMKK